MYKRVIVVILLILLVVGGLSMILISEGNTPVKNNTQATESYDAMMRRMHPNQPSNNDMSSHHGGAP